MNSEDDIYSKIMHEITQSVLYFGLDAGLSTDISQAVTERLRKVLGKDTVYFPEKHADRNAQIRAAYDGRNRKQVCEQFGISQATFYRAIGDKG